MATRRLVAIGIRNPRTAPPRSRSPSRKPSCGRRPAGQLPGSASYLHAHPFVLVDQPAQGFGRGVRTVATPDLPGQLRSPGRAEATQLGRRQAVGQGYLVVGYRSRVASMPARTLGSKPASTCVAWASRTSFRTGGRARRRRRSPARPPCRTAQGANARRPPGASVGLAASLTREVRRRVHGEINKDPRGTAPEPQHVSLSGIRSVQPLRPRLRACGPREARDGQLRNDALAAESQFSALPVRMAL